MKFECFKTLLYPPLFSESIDTQILYKAQIIKALKSQFVNVQQPVLKLADPPNM